MLALYFSGTGNTKYIAQLFGEKLGARCLSTEAQVDFPAELATHDTIAFCYPIYGSRVPLIMREFVGRHVEALRGKKLIVLVTQVAFSGDGARAFLDLLPPDHMEVLYAEHFPMPNNVCNLWPLYRRQSSRRIATYIRHAEETLGLVCADIQAGHVKKRGFSKLSWALGKLQGPAWQGRAEALMGRNLRIHDACTVCGLCVRLCPMQNLAERDGKIVHNHSCTVCYRCVNSCPARAITVYIHQRPKWQYHGIGSEGVERCER